MNTTPHALLEHPRRRQARQHPFPLGATWPHRAQPRANANRPARRARRPAWFALYALLPLAALLCGLAEYVPASGGWRRLAEGFVAFIVLASAWIWVRANRSALSRMASGPDANPEGHDVSVEVQEAPPQVILLEPRRSRPTR